MTDPSDSRLSSLFRSLSARISVGVFVIGVAVLIGWLSDIATLKAFHPKLVTMKPNAAVCFTLSGVALWLLRTKPLSAKSAVVRRRCAQGCALVITVVASLTLLEFVFRADFGIDQLLFREAPGALLTPYPGRMAPITALIFLLIGPALLLLDVEIRRGIRPAQFLILLASVLSLLGFFGYLYGAFVFFGRPFPFVAMALPTMLASVALCVGLMAARPDRGLMMLVTSEGLGGAMVRRLLPAVLVLPVAFDLLTMPGERAGLYDSYTQSAVMVMMVIVAFALIAYRVSRSLERTEAERRRSVVALVTSEQKYRQLFESSRDSLMTLFPPEWKFTSANAATVELFGAKDEKAFTSLEPWDVSPERQPDGELSSLQAKRAIETAMEQGSHFFDWTHKRVGGASFPATVLLTRVELEGKAGLQATVRFVTELRRVAEALRESEGRFRSVAETANEAIISVDDRGRVLVWNPAAETIFGYSSAETIGQPLTLIIPERFQAAHNASMSAVVSTGHSNLAGTTLQVPGRRKDGTEFPAELSLAHWKTEKAVFFTGIIRDITDRKRVEAERERQIGELRELLANVKTLSGLIPICASCKKIRDDKGYWSQVESYVAKHSTAQFSHGICPDCMKKLYPDMEE